MFTCEKGSNARYPFCSLGISFERYLESIKIIIDAVIHSHSKPLNIISQLNEPLFVPYCDNQI